MENQENNIQLKDNTANPAPLGLAASGMTTILLNFHNAGFFALGSSILGMGIFFGGLAQVIAGIMEWKKNNTFGTTAFASYGFFWLSLVALIILPKMGYGTAPDKNEMGAYLALWGLFTLFMFVGTLRLNVALQFVFGSLTILFFLLALGHFTENEIIEKIAGYEGIFCGLCAFYASLAQVLNEVYGKTVMPICPVKKK